MSSAGVPLGAHLQSGMIRVEQIDPAELSPGELACRVVGAVGVYVIRIYKDVRGRPPYIVESTIGVAAQAERVQS